MTRKGLAWAAFATLVGSTLVGLPAQANTENLAIIPSTGSQFVVPSNNTFVFKAYYKPGVSATNASTLKVRLTTNGTFQLNADSDSTAAAAVNSLASTVASGSTSAVVNGGTTSVDFVGLAINSASASTTYTVTAQAFEDVDGSGTISTGEWVSAVQTITFIKTSDIKWTLALDPVYVGATGKLSATVTSNVNLSQLANGDGTDTSTNAAQVFGAFSEDSTAAGTQSDVDSSVLYAPYDAIDDAYYFEAGTNVDAALAAGDTAKFYLWFRAANAISTIGDVNTAIKTGGKSHNDPAVAASASTSKVVVATQVSTLGAVSTVPAAGVGATSGGGANAVSGSGTVTLRTLATPVSGVSKSGHVVTFTVREDTVNDLDAAATITVGGKTLKNTNGGGSTLEKITATAVTDSDGYASITLTYAGTKDGNEIDVTAAIDGVSASEVNLEWKDRTVSAVANVTAVGASEIYNVATSTSYTILAAAKDQFGAAITDAGYSVKATVGSTNIVAPVSNGVATLVMPAIATAGAVTVTLQGQKNGVDAGSTETVAVVIGGSAKAVTNVTYSAALTGAGANYGVGSDTDLALQTKTFTNVDTRKAGFAPTVDSNYLTITATALDADQAVVAGTSVTFSGDYLDFEVDGVYVSGTVTVQTNSNGQAAVKVYSSVSGAKTLTIKSGSSTKTQSIVYAAGGAATATSLELNVPATAPAGKTLAVTGGAKDKFGNYVTATDFEVTYSGPGFYSTLPTSLTNGKFSFNVLLGSNDTGVATITASIYTGTDKITVTKQVQIGVGAGTVNVGSFNGKLVVYAKDLAGSRISWKVGGNWGSATAVGNTLNRFDRPTPRSGVTLPVEIYVNGVKQLTKSVVTR